MANPILQQLDLPNIFTLTGLSISLMAVIMAINGNFNVAIICMMCAALIDMFDGVVARKMERTSLQSKVGKELDTIVDMCSFGLTPAIFAYCIGLQDILSILILIFYISMGALRLAYFSSTGLTVSNGKEFFTGLPIPYIILFISPIFTASFLLPGVAMKWIFDGVYLLMAIAMVADFKMIKLQGIWHGIFLFGAVVLTVFYGWAALWGHR